MKALCFIVCLAIGATAVAQQKTYRRLDRDQYKRDADYVWDVLYRARQVAPGRRDAPLRELNLTDDEVREIQAATRSYLPNAYLNISPVVTGCPCEEGGECTAQVYVLADAGARSKGLQLSRIKNEWKVGDVQKWWLDFERLLSQRASMDFDEYTKAELKVASTFPVCTAPVNAQAAPITAKAKEPPK